MAPIVSHARRVWLTHPETFPLVAFVSCAIAGGLLSLAHSARVNPDVLLSRAARSKPLKDAALLESRSEKWAHHHTAWLPTQGAEHITAFGFKRRHAE